MKRVSLKFLGFAGLLLAVSLSGCGEAKVAPHNLRLTMSLRTAVSARNAEWLDANVALIQQRRAAGEMGDEEHEAFQAIVALAHEGKWEEAEKAVVRLQKAQRPEPPSPDRQQLAHDHAHDH